jgi:hypothetical protein
MTPSHWIAVLLAIGGVLRLIGVTYGLPFPLVSDEEVLIGGAMRMMELRTLLPVIHGDAMNILYYPPVLSYLYLFCMAPVLAWLYLANGLPSIDQFGMLVLNNIELIWISARLTSVAFGTATIYLTYRVTHAITNSPTAGIAAAALLSVDFMHTMLSHVARHWSATVFIIWLTAWFAIRYYHKPSTKLALVIGLCSGLGFGTSYIGILGMGFALVAHFACWHKKQVSLLGREAIALILSVSSVSALFVAIHPFPFLRLLKGTVVPIYKEKTLAGWLDLCSFYLDALWQSNPVLVLAALAGVAACMLTSRWRLLAGAIASVIIYTAFLFKALPLEDRYILPITPALAMLGGYAYFTLYRASGLVPAGRPALFFMALIALAIPLLIAAWTSIMLHRADTREQAKDWIETNLKSNTPVLINMNTVRLYPDRESLLAQSAFDRQSLKAVDRLRINLPKHIDKELGRTTLNLWQLSPDGIAKGNSSATANSLLESGYSYYVFDTYGASQMQEFHSAIIARMGKIVEFRPCPPPLVPPMLRTTTLISYPMHRLLDCERFGPVVTIMQAPDGHQH